MGYAYAADKATRHGATQARYDITTTTTIEGNLSTWNITTAAAEYTITVAEYDSTRRSQYRTDINGQPIIVIKCAVDTDTFNVLVVSSDGAGSTTTHMTFDGDYSSTPRYLALRLTEGADGTYIWEAA